MEVENDDSDDTRNALKHRKVELGEDKEEAIDFISNLPESLILYILSFLHAFDAVRTTVLSKRWHNLWTYCLTLDFDLYDVCEEEYYNHEEGPTRFLSFVNCTLLFHRSPKINKMIICTVYEKSFANDINAWILFAMRKSVHELQLIFGYCDDIDEEEEEEEDDKHVLPSYMLNCPSLVTLKLTFCSFEGHKLPTWKSLRELFLCSMALSNNLIRDILSGCPVLESLKLTSCKDIDYIDIKSKNLAKLVIMNHRVHESNADGLKITAPYLRSLHISGYLNRQSVSLSNTSASLVDATITFTFIAGDLERSREMFTKGMRELVEKIRLVKNLTIGNYCFQVLSMVLVESAQSCPFSNLACLKIHTSLKQAEVHALARLLALTPLLDTLVLYMTPSDSCQMVQKWWSLKSSDVKADSFSFWASNKSLLAATMLNLKIVKIFNVGGSNQEMKLIAYILHSARRLENMIIQSTNVFYPRLEESLRLILSQSKGVWRIVPSASRGLSHTLVSLVSAWGRQLVS